MKRTIFFSTLVIVLVIVLTAAATWAYFGGSKQKSATLSTALIAVGETWGFDLTFGPLLPDETSADEFAIQNGGNRDADFYAQMVGWTGDEGDPNYLNFCLGSLGVDAVNVWIQEIDGWNGNVISTHVNGESICGLYPGHPGAWIPKIGDDVPKDGIRYYRVTLKLNGAAGIEYMNKFNTDTVNLIAVQFNGPGPSPDLNSFYNPWPVDTPPDNDPNY